MKYPSFNGAILAEKQETLAAQIYYSIDMFYKRKSASVEDLIILSF